MRILNFGSVNIDHVYRVDEFVKPGQTVSSLSLERFCGGKGLNQSIALARAGAKVMHAGKTGSDGDMLRKRLCENGVDISLLGQSSVASGHAVIQVDRSGQNCILLFGGANQDITRDDADRVLSGFGKGDILVLQNEISSLEYIVKTAFQKGMRIALNPSPVEEKLRGLIPFVTWLILNEDEGAALSGCGGGPEAVAKSLLGMNASLKVVLTLGKRGVYYKDALAAYTHGIYRVPVVDTTAAGDTFTGYFIACVSRGESVPNALRYASVASSLAVSRRGASDSIPLWAEVKDARLEPV